MLPHRRRLVATIIKPTSRESIWITDRLLQASLNRFSRACPSSCRYGSSVPGPLEAQKRRRGRKMASLSNVSSLPHIGLDWSPLESALDLVRKRLREIRPGLPATLDWTQESTTIEAKPRYLVETPSDKVQRRNSSVDLSSIYVQLMEMADAGFSTTDPEWARLEAILCTKHKNHATQYLRRLDDDHLCDLFFRYFAPAEWQPAADSLDVLDNSDFTPFTRNLLHSSTELVSVAKVLPELTRYLFECRRTDLLILTLSQLNTRNVSVDRKTVQRICSQLTRRDARLAAAVVTALNSTDFASIEMIIRKALETRTLSSKRLVNLLVRASKSDSWLTNKDERYIRRQQRLTDLVHDVATYVVDDPGLGNRTALRLLQKLLSIEMVTARASLIDQLILVGLTRPTAAAEDVPAQRVLSILDHVVRVKGLAAADAVRRSLSAWEENVQRMS